jgi:hypothetical protein
MRPMAEVFIPVLLIGCFVAAVAVAGEQKGAGASCGGPYANRTPTPKDLVTILRNHQPWLESGKRSDAKRRANLCRAVLIEANLQGAYLNLAHLQGADLGGAELGGAVFEPKLEALPDILSLAESRLEGLVFCTSPAALITLREAFKKTGMRTQERQLTYAVEHTKMLQAWDSSLINLPCTWQSASQHPLPQCARKPTMSQRAPFFPQYPRELIPAMGWGACCGSQAPLGAHRGAATQDRRIAGDTADGDATEGHPGAEAEVNVRAIVILDA